MEFSVLDALSTTVVAMIIVFSLLVILQYIIRLESFIIETIANKNDQHNAGTSHNKQGSEKPREEQIIEVETKDELEVVAVIAAALSTYLKIPNSNLKIKSIKRISNNSGWGI